jgi:predicted RNase H-like nuclease (RuvC/YqgF family)
MIIPSEILVPAIVAIVLAVIAHFVSLSMQKRASQHDFKIKSFDSVNKELADSRKETEQEREKYSVLNRENLSLSALNYRLIGEIESLKRDKEALKRDLEELKESTAEQKLSTITHTKEHKEEIFKLVGEIEWLKKRNKELEQKIEEIN